MLQKGMLTTVQDGGRRGHQSSGVTVCGAMDLHALAVANLLVGNAQDEAALEVTGMGPELCFHTAAAFAVCGGDFAPLLDGQPIEMNRAYIAPAGAVLRLQAARGGFRAYIAVGGGLDIPVVMGSRSTCLSPGFGGFEGRALERGDRIGLRAPCTWLPGLARRRVDFPVAAQPTVRAVPGPQAESFSEAGLETFFSGVYTVTPESNRMGYRTQGPAIEFAEGHGSNIISDGIAPGAVQVPNGMPIIMMADRQTVGGYAKIATVITADLPLIAQLRPGDSLTFSRCSVAEAQAAARDRARRLRNLAWELDSPAGEY